MKNKVRQLFRDKLVLVMTVLGLLTIVAAAGTVKIRKDNAQDGRNPYLDVPQTEGILAEEMPQNRLEENDGTGRNTRTGGRKFGRLVFGQ